MKKITIKNWRQMAENAKWYVGHPLKSRSQEAFRDALNTIGTTDDARIGRAWDTFYDKGTQKESLIRAIDLLTDDEELKKAAKKAFCKVKRYSRRGIAAILATVFILSIAFMPAKLVLPQSLCEKMFEQGYDPNKGLMSRDNLSRVNKAARKLMANNGWGHDQYTIVLNSYGAEGTAAPIKDAAEAGSLCFTDKGLYTPQQMTEWLSGNSDEAEAYLRDTEDENKVERSYILNPDNWVTIIVADDTDFVYPDNTGYKNGKVVDCGKKAGQPGEVFLILILPDDSGVATRSACGNPQDSMPKPITGKGEETTTPNEEETTQPEESTTIVESTAEQETTTTTSPEETTTKPTTTTTTTAATTTKEAKKPWQDVLVNPSVADWKKEDPSNEPTKSVVEETSKSNGYNPKPHEDATAASSKAEESSKAAETTHQAAVSEAVTSGAGVVDSDQTHVAVTGGPSW